MANTNAPFGLRFIGLKGGGVTNSSLETRRNGILYTNSETIFTGDLVRSSANGYIYQWDASTAVSQCLGVFVGCQYASNSQQTIVSNKYWPGTDAADGTVLAKFVPSQLAATPLFVIQTDSTGITVADVGANADITVGTGSTTTGMSASVLNTGSLNTTATLPLRIVDLWANYSMGNYNGSAGGSSSLAAGTQAGAYNWAVVAINNMGTTGV